MQRVATSIMKRARLAPGDFWNAAVTWFHPVPAVVATGVVIGAYGGAGVAYDSATDDKLGWKMKTLAVGEGLAIGGFVGGTVAGMAWVLLPPMMVLGFAGFAVCAIRSDIEVKTTEDGGWSATNRRAK